jgi:lauroyl/myristoyl acyltransferase
VIGVTDVAFADWLALPNTMLRPAAAPLVRASPSIAAKLRESEDELARLHAQANEPPTADIERLVPRLAEEIERAVRELPKTVAAGNVGLARQELNELVGSIRVVAKPTEMLL